MLASGEQVHRERFGAGLELLWLHAPHSLQAALALELDGGSHDEPAAYPGLAHFLEHMVFRGSRGYAVGDGLMSYVQQVGGSVNASTRGCRTLFHFQVAEQALLSASERLFDQLLEPLLDLALQRAEREVIDAEFHLRAGDPDTLIDAAVGTALGRAHGAAGFHAGNRDSLPVELSDFQQALQAYHQTVYRQAAVRLVVVSAVPAQEGLRAMRSLLQHFAEGRKPWRSEPPPSFDLDCSHALHLSINGSQLRHVLVVAVETQAQSMTWLVGLLNDSASQSLESQLLEAGIEARMHLRVLHAQGEQALLAFDFSLAPASWERRGVLRGALLDWLRACQAHVLDDGWLAHMREAQHWQWPLCSALDKAQHLLERMTCVEPVYHVSLAAWLAPVEAGQCLEVSVDSRVVAQRRVRGFDLALEEEPLPLTQPIVPRLGAAPYSLYREWRTALTPQPWSGAHLRPQWSDPAVVALFLHWADAAPSSAGLRGLQARLLPLQREAGQVGVRLDLCQSGAALSLQLLGNVAAVAGVLQQALPLLQGRWPEDVGELPPSEAGIALRQLLQALPSLLHSADSRHVQQLPEHCSGLLLCHDDVLIGQIGAVCAAQALQVQAVVPYETSAVASDRRWQHLPLPGTECALLLFIAAPEDVIGQAAWHLLGQCLPDAFQRQLRDEQQLGYALFCGYRQFDGCAGLLFAVQSARADAAAIWRALDAFLQAQVRRIAELTSAEWQVIGQHLRDQLKGAGSSLHASAQAHYHAWLADQVQTYPQALLAALDAFTPAELADWLELLRTRSPHLVLSSAASPWA